MSEQVKLAEGYKPSRGIWKGLKMAGGAALAVAVYQLTADSEFATAVGKLFPAHFSGYVTAAILGLGVHLRNRQKQLAKVR